jgi:hypothetical protein
VILDAADATHRLAIGHATMASASFNVTKAGVLNATGANITGNITGGNLVVSNTGAIYSTGKTSYADTDAGFFLGYDTDAYKFNIGDADSYWKWSGSAMAVQMASGDSFDLYGDFEVKSGGNITIDQGGDLILSKGSIGDPSMIRFQGADTVNGLLRFEDGDDADTYFELHCEDMLWAGDYSYLSGFTLSIAATASTSSTVKTMVFEGMDYIAFNPDISVVSLSPVFADKGLAAKQLESDGALPPLYLQQQDVSEEFIEFVGYAADGDLTQTIVDADDVDMETTVGYLKIFLTDKGDRITDQAYYIPFYTLTARP